MERIRDKREIVPTDSMSDLITSLVQQEVGERLSGIIDGKWDEAKRAISQNQPCCLALCEYALSYFHGNCDTCHHGNLPSWSDMTECSIAGKKHVHASN